MKREISAGCVVYRSAKNGKEIVLIRPKDRPTWALPKGLLNAGESSETAAAREVREETGLEGRLDTKIDTIKYTYTATWQDPPERIFKIVTFYLMECTGGDTADHDWEVEQVQWLPIDDAIRKASYSSEKNVLRKAKNLLEGQGARAEGR